MNIYLSRVSVCQQGIPKITQNQRLAHLTDIRKVLPARILQVQVQVLMSIFFLKSLSLELEKYLPIQALARPKDILKVQVHLLKATQRVLQHHPKDTLNPVLLPQVKDIQKVQVALKIIQKVLQVRKKVNYVSTRWNRIFKGNI